MIRRCLALSLLFLASAGFASAQDFTFTYNGSANGSAGDTASGTLITTPTSTTGEFLITSITNGFFDNSAITLLSPGAIGGNDNLLFDPGAPGYVDITGFSFSTAAGSDFNLYYDGAASDGYQVLEGDSPSDTAGTFTVTELNTSPTPEPNSLLLLGTGLLGAFAVLRRKVAA